MANVKTRIDEWSVRDLEDNSSLNIVVEDCTELGNNSKPGIQVMFMGKIINFEPNIVEQWVYKAGKEGVTEYVLDDSWLVHTDQYVKISLLTGTPLKARVEVKTRSSKPVIKEYPLPFQF
jgi:ABC-type taurine transport system substrate-binding protein